jgi:hypothetical protein
LESYKYRSNSITRPSRLPKKEEEDAQLETLLLEGLAGGADIPVTPEFWKDLKAEARDIDVKHKGRKRSCP